MTTLRADIPRPAPPAAEKPFSPVDWIVRPAIGLAILLPLVVTMTVDGEYITGALIACLNCILIVGSVLYFMKKDPLLGLVPAIAFPTYLTAAPASCLYFAMAGLEHTKYTGLIHQQIPYLREFPRVQFAYLVFFAAILAGMAPFFRRRSNETGMPITNPGGLVVFTSTICIVILACFDVVSVLRIEEGLVAWVVRGLFNYANGLLLITGALINYAPVPMRAALGTALVLHLGVNAVGNARMPGFIPILFAVVGFIFLSTVKPSRKALVIGVMCVLFPAYLVIANTTRTIFKTSSFEHFERRLEVLVERSGQIAQRENLLVATFQRLFMTGGHSIISRTPNEQPYFSVEPAEYIGEMFTALVPGRIYFNPWYQSNWHLKRYGFYLKGTSVEISLIGHFWMFGGFYALLIGGFLSGVQLGVIVWLLRRARRKSWSKALIFASILATTLFSFPALDFIANFRSIVWRTLLAVLIYQFVRLMVPERQPEAARTPVIPSAAVPSSA